MKIKLIKIEEDFYVVDDSRIVKNNYRMMIDKDSIIFGQFEKHLGIGEVDNKWNKITHSTKQLDDVIHINLLDVEEVVYGYNVEKLSEDRFPKDILETSKNCFDDLNLTNRSIWVEGFEAHEELVKDTFTLNEIENALKELSKVQYKFDSKTTFKDLLYKQKKSQWNITINSNNKITLI